MNKLKIKDIVYSVSETHPFNFEKLYAINTSDVFQGKIINTTMISTDELKGQFKKTIQSNDILFSEIRPINKHFAKVNLTDTKRYVVSTKLMVLRKHNINVDLDYFYYCLTNNVFLKILQSRAENRICSFPQITFDLLGEYSIPIPEMRIQKQIAKTIKNIDSKIEFNNKINDELENMAKTIYDYWFLQFEFPNEDGKPYKSSGGKMVWNEELKREIPEGWSYEYISNISKIIAGGDKDENIQVNCDKDHTIPVYSNSEKNKGLYGFTQKATLEEPCITVSARGTIGLSFIRLEPFVPIIRLICVIPNNIEYLKFLEISLNKIDYRKNGSIQQQLTVPQLASYKFIFPNKIILEKYHKITMNIQKKILENEKENQELISLRDFLLPLLMNGQVGFKDKENKSEG